MSDELKATVREINGQLVLDDPVALAVITAIEKINCKRTLDAQMDRVQHFANRIVEKGLTPADAVIVLLNVDGGGGQLADLMPSFDPAPIRAIGQVPFARGLATRGGMQDYVDSLDTVAGDKFRAISGIAVVVMDFGVVEVFEL